MKKISLAVLFLVSFWAKGQAQEVLEKIVGVVGSEYILYSDVEEATASAKEQRGGNIPADYPCMVLDGLLMQKLLLNQAKIDSVEVKDDDVDSQLEARVNQILTYMGGNIDQFVAYYGKRPEEMKSEMRDDLKNQLQAEKMRGKVLSDITVTPSEIKNFFAKIPKDSLPYFNQEVEVSEIVVKPQPNNLEKQKARELLESLRSRIMEKNEDFAALAKKYSEDPGSSREGGDLGFAKRGAYVPEFEAAAYKLAEKEISPVVETEYGYHIMQMLERRGNNIHLRHILIKPNITDDVEKLAEKLLDSVRLEILKDSISFSVAVKKFGDKKVQSYNSDGRLANQASGTNLFETKDLDPEIYFAIDTIKKIGGITKPIAFTNVMGEKAYRIVKLSNRTTPHKASLETDYNKIQSACIEQKKTLYLVNWMSQKINGTYLNISADYSKKCPSLQRWKGEKIKP